MIDPISLDLSEGIFDKRIPVSHADVSPSVDAAARERLFERACLLFGDAAKGRAAADLLIVASRLLVALGRDKPGERLLQSAPWESNDVRIDKEIEEERANVVERLRPAEIE